MTDHALVDFCDENNINLKLKKGIKQYDDIGHIINEEGEWQFDIFMTQYCKDNTNRKPLLKHITFEIKWNNI